MSTLVVVRHGRTRANAARQLLGRRDVPLDALGQAQAAALAAAVGPVDRVVTSPLLRARQTAAAFDAPVAVDDRFIELDYGTYDGMALADVPLEFWDQLRSGEAAGELVDHTADRFESLAALRRRVEAGLEEVRASEDATTVVVTHVSPVKAAVTWAMGVGDEATWRLFVHPASISRIEVTPRGPVLHSFNEVAHLADLVDPDGV